MLGKLRETTFRLQKRRCYRNSFAPCFLGRFVARDGDTFIEGDFGLHPFVKVFMFFWFSGLVLFVALVLVNPSAERPATPWERVGLLLGGRVMAALGVGMVRFGRWLGREEEGTILDFLKRTLEADETA